MRFCQLFSLVLGIIKPRLLPWFLRPNRAAFWVHRRIHDVVWFIVDFHDVANTQGKGTGSASLQAIGGDTGVSTYYSDQHNQRVAYSR